MQGLPPSMTNTFIYALHNVIAVAIPPTAITKMRSKFVDCLIYLGKDNTALPVEVHNNLRRWFCLSPYGRLQACLQHQVTAKNGRQRQTLSFCKKDHQEKTRN
jgi:hypothetical protein